jgi:hypothetical protein
MVLGRGSELRARKYITQGKKSGERKRRRAIKCNETRSRKT